MQDEYSNEEIASLVEKALSFEENHFFPKTGLSIGFGESKAFETLADSLQSKYAYSEIATAFQDAREVLVKEKLSYTIKDLHTQVLNCRKCKNFSPSPNLPMWNVTDPEVVFILDYPIYDRTVAEYFMNTLKDSGYSSKSVCLTYVNRCNYPKRKFEPEEVYNCSPYLHTEIQLMNPKLIVCLGALAATAVFGRDMTIKDYRSQIIWLGSFPVMMTYSPSHVLKAGSSYQDQFSADIIYSHSYIKKKES
jgi:DNA polymerase